MPRYDSRQLIDNIERLIAGTAESSIPDPRLEPASPPTTPGVPKPAEDANTAVRALNLTIFPALREHQRVDKVPDGARFAMIKRVFMLGLRLISLRQAAFNYFSFSAHEVLAQHVDALRRKVESMDAAIAQRHRDFEMRLLGLQQMGELLRESHDYLDTRHAITESRQAENAAGLAAADAAHKALEARLQVFESRLQSLQAELHHEAKARLGETTTRVEQLERELRQGLQNSYQASHDMVQSVWKGLEERDHQLKNTTMGVQECHSQISHLEQIGHEIRTQIARLDTIGRDCQGRLLVLNEEVNVHLDALLTMRKLLEGKPGAGVAVATAGGNAPTPTGVSPAAAAVSPVASGAAASGAVPAAVASASVVAPAAAATAAVAPASAGSSPAAAPAAGGRRPLSLEESQLDLAYLRFQRQFRGDEARLRDRQKQYVDLIQKRLNGGGGANAGGAQRKLLDLACGDGIFLDLWRDKAGWECKGIDLSPAMVRLGRSSGLPLEEADAIGFVETAPEQSFDVITSFQFIEHLEKDALMRLLRGCRRSLKPGGLLLLETLNPHTLMAHKWYHLDLTHKRLIFPETLALLVETIGLRVLEHVGVSEVHESERLQLLGDPRLQSNFDRLNQLLFGKQDYYLLAQRP